MSSPIDLTGDDDYIYANKTPKLREVNVKLQSLDGELDRNIFFSEKIGLLNIAVGRASKNVVRGMFPQRGNAWIESPVMSRNHAQLFIEPGDGQSVYIEDLDSTHGTKVNGERLRPKKKTKLLTGDKISLGSAVRAGLNEFKPKEFQVKCDWKRINASPIVLTPSPSTEHNPQSRTYSVPSPGDSEDEDEEELYGKTPLGEEKEFTITMERQVEHSSDSLQQEQFVADLVDYEAGSRDDTAYEKQGKADHIIVSSNASDDEAPEVLPINGSDAHRTKSTVSRGFTLQYESDSESAESDYVQEVSSSGNAEDGATGSPPRSPEKSIPKSPSYSPSSPVYSPTARILREYTPEFIEGTTAQRAIDGWFDQVDDIDVYDDVDDEQDEPHSIEYPSSSSGESSDSHGSDMSESDESQDPDESDNAVSVASNDDEYPRDEDVRKDLNNLSTLMSNIDDDVRPQTVAINAPRVPSPSDAALARSSSTMEAVKAGQPLPIHRYDQQDSSDVTLTSAIGSGGTMVANNQLAMNEESYEPVPFEQQDFFGLPGVWTNQDNIPKPAYSQGPFAIFEDCSNSETRPSSSLPLNSHNNSTSCGYTPFPGSRPFDPLYGPSCIRQDPVILTSPRTSWPSVNASPTQSFQDNENNGCDLPPPTRPSRLRISQLVNETPDTVTSTERSDQSLKRKADKISTSEHISRSSDSYTLAMSDRRISSSFNNEVPVQPSNDFNADNSSGTRTCDYVEAELNSKSSKASAPATAPTIPAEFQHIQTGHGDDEPPSSRARTESYRPTSRRAWFWKAATHTAAGVLGAVAFAAAMIATVPDDVKNEAFAEY